MKQSKKIVEWPPTYTVKTHPRAKYVNLAYSKSAGLEVTVPINYNTHKLPKIIEENKDWIQKQQERFDRADAHVLPGKIKFKAVHQTWTVNYLINDRKPRIKHFSNYEILMYGQLNDFQVCREKLLAWVKRMAKSQLTPIFRDLSTSINLPYRDLTIRTQNTLWGSCSEDASINLNYKLIFLPEHLMRHIMIHELCHTVYLDHSRQFWKLVEKFDPDWEENDKAMKHADRLIPGWI